ncbi:MAG TPA: fibronectin type III domain-containing protein [Bacteroidota bacterium]|nr:fibronectin type III domain-containing protein [Bacteroidota bacterium]
MHHCLKTLLIGALIAISASCPMLQGQQAALAPTATPARGGKYVTSSGTLNILFVYVQFPDDRYLPDSPNWPAGKPPVYLNGTVDSLWTAQATPGSFTDYFNQMSFNKLKITGRSVFTITPHTRTWYCANGKRRGFITRETIEQLDATVDFAPFDNWKSTGEYAHANVPDSVVDMIVMMWRNVCNDTSDVRNELDLVPGGEASLGYESAFTVDHGARRVNTGFGTGGSGITVIHPRSGDLGLEIIWRYARHEFGHWLFGSNDYHTDLGTWGLVDGWGTPGDCMNSYERNKLGWITCITIDDVSAKRTLRNVSLSDFVTTGAAYRIRVPGGGPNEYYLLENHQRISRFDIPDNNVASAKGLYVLLQRDDVGGAVGIVSAEGRFDWSVPYQRPNIYGSGDLPVFQRGESNRVSGYSKRQNIPWTWENNPQRPAAIHYYLDPLTREIRKAPPTIFTGDGKDQFDLTNARVFTPASNPSSDLHASRQKIGFEITDIKKGSVRLTLFINTTEESSPSKPQDVSAMRTRGNTITVTWTPNEEANVQRGGGYNIYRTLLRDSSVVSARVRVNRTLLRKTSYTDTADFSRIAGGAGSNVVARYTIEAVNRKGKRSVQSDAAVCFIGLPR